MIPRHGERGYASVAAVAAIAVFGMMALTLVQVSQTTIGDAAAEVGQARAAAATDAGLALTLDGLLARDRANRWSIDGRSRQLRFDGAQLVVRIEDERGKVPLNLLDDTTARALIAAAGAGAGEKGRIAAESLLDWIDNDEVPRPSGAENAFYRARGIHPRNGPLQTIDELAQVRGFDAALVNRLRSFVTVDYGSGAFDARYAQPEAIGVMLGGGRDGPQAIARRRELAGQRVAIELGDNLDLAGRPLTVVVEAVRPDGARALRRTIIELTGSPERPYIVRKFD